jgi:hypothetical protein
VAVALFTIFVAFNAKADSGKGNTPTPPAPATAVPAIPLPTSAVCMTTFSGRARDFDELLELYEQGPHTEFQERLAKIAAKIGQTTDQTGFCPGPLFAEKDRIAFVIVDDHAVQPIIVRVLQGTAPAPSPASIRLILNEMDCAKGTYEATCKPGWPLYTVYLFRSTASPPIASSYVASPSPGPIQAGVKQAITAMAGGMVKMAAPVQTPLGEREAGVKAAGKGLPAMITRTVVPTEIRWAQILVSDKADLRGFLTPAEVQRRVQALFPGSELQDYKESAFKAFADEKKPKLKELQDLLAKALTTSKALEETTQIQRIYQMYAVLLTDLSGETSIQTVYAYGKLTSVTFGLGLGAVVDFNLNHQVKISDETLVDDTPNGVMTSVNLYWSVFGGYDETMLRPSRAESLPGVVVGAVLTPDFGGFVGMAIPLGFVRDVRSFTLNGGYALMLATVPAGSAQIGDSGSMATTRRGALGGWFLTLGYSF